MRHRRGTLGICLTNEQGADSDKRQCSLGTQGSPHLSVAPSWMSKPAIDVHGKSQNETLSLERKSDLSEANLSPHSGTKVLTNVKESVRKNPASPEAQSKTVDVLLGFTLVSCGVEDALVRDWLGGGPGTTNSLRGQCYRGGPWEVELPCCQLSEMVISEDDPSAFLEARGSDLDPSCLHSVLSTPLRAHPEVFPNGETACLPGHSQPMLSEQTADYRKVLPSVKSTSADLQTTLGFWLCKLLK